MLQGSYTWRPTITISLYQNTLLQSTDCSLNISIQLDLLMLSWHWLNIIGWLSTISRFLAVFCFFLHSRRQRIFGWKGRLLNRSHLTNITVMMAMVRMKYRKVQMKGGNGGCWMSSIEANQGLIGLSSWIDLINNNNIPILKSQTASNTTYLKIFPGH